VNIKSSRQLLTQYSGRKYTLRETKKQEEDVIEAILLNDGYLIKREHNGEKHVAFSDNRKAVRTITGLFRKTELKIACKIENMLRSHLQTNKATNNRYELSRVYRLKFGECQYMYAHRADRTTVQNAAQGTF
jgi:hypothetical protein